MSSFRLKLFHNPSRFLVLAVFVSLVVHAFLIIKLPAHSELLTSGTSMNMGVSLSWKEQSTESIPLNNDASSSDTKHVKVIEVIEVRSEHAALQESTTPVPKINEPPLKDSVSVSQNTVVSSSELISDHLTRSATGFLKEEKVQSVEEELRSGNDEPSKEIVQEPIAVTSAVSKTDTKKAIEQSDTQLQKHSSSREKPVANEKLTNDMSTVRYQLGSNNNPEPVYPSLARKRGWQGQVILGVYVRPDGSIEHLTFVKSTDYGILNFEAYETVRNSWQFKPIDNADTSKDVSYIEVPITFSFASR